MLLSQRCAARAAKHAADAQTSRAASPAVRWPLRPQQQRQQRATTAGLRCGAVFFAELRPLYPSSALLALLAPAARVMPKGPTSSKPARPKTHKPKAVPAAAESEAGPSIVPTQNGGGKSAMDDIFSSFAPKREQRDAARQQQAAAAEEAAAAEAAAAKRAKKRKREKVIDPVFGEEYDLDRTVDPQNAKVHRHDSSSGLRVYKAHDLGLGRGGGTPLCPFDCKCCF